MCLVEPHAGSWFIEDFAQVLRSDVEFDFCPASKRKPDRTSGNFDEVPTECTLLWKACIASKEGGCWAGNRKRAEW